MSEWMDDYGCRWVTKYKNLKHSNIDCAVSGTKGYKLMEVLKMLVKEISMSVRSCSVEILVCQTSD